MSEFLKTIATQFYTTYGDLSDFCFVFPSKRSGNFFRKYLKETLPTDKFMLSPKIQTINDFIVDTSGLVVDNRIDLLFRLYKEYQRLRPEENIDFDRFMPWGDTILSDFNDIDMYDVNPDALFKNLSDYKEIQSDYLTDEQRKIISEYFGITNPNESTNKFWKHFSKGRKSDAKSGFLKIWKVLTPLYNALNDSLAKDGLCYSGRAYKETYTRLKSDIRKYIPYCKIVFVGFNILSTVEFKIFSLLKDYHYIENGQKVKIADFYWDCAGPIFKDSENSATRFVNKNKEIFKSELDISDADTTEFPHIVKAISSPSNSIQAKISQGIIHDIVSRTCNENALRRAKIAVVLPDENLLLPLLYSMPEEIKTANLTMGYPLQLTSTASFVSILRKLQTRKRSVKGDYAYFHEDLKELLTHPYMRLLLGHNTIRNIKNDINQNRRFTIKVSDIEKFLGKYVCILTPLTKESAPEDVCDYLSDTLRIIKEKLMSDKTNSLIKSRLDITHIDTYIDALVRLKSAITTHKIKQLSFSGVFNLSDKLLAGEKVNFEGEPLEGLQVMGTLETRCLDFDYIIIPSMNERIFPQKLKTRTFIPNTLRIGYGMSTLQFQECIFAYHFYRMISRAKEIYMIYDARSSGMKSGDISRYIHQLRYLYPQCNLQSAVYTFDTSQNEVASISIDKTNPIVKAELAKYLDPDSKKNLSASALKAYIDCPLKFYFQNVKGLSVDEEPEEFMDAATLGDILHKTMEGIYTPDINNDKTSGLKLPEGKLYTKEVIDKKLKNFEAEVQNIIDKNISSVYLKLKTVKSDKELNEEGDVAIFRKVIKTFVTNCLKADLKAAPFVYWGSEIKKNLQWELPDKRKINLTFIIDRLDETNINSQPTIRICDYKTGSDGIECKKSVDNLFTPGKSNMKAIFQLMTYAILYRHKDGFNYKGDIELHIYKTRDMHTREFSTATTLPSSKTALFDTDTEANFIEKFNNLLTEIFDENIKFKQTKNKTVCEWCSFKELCNNK